MWEGYGVCLRSGEVVACASTVALRGHPSADLSHARGGDFSWPQTGTFTWPGTFGGFTDIDDSETVIRAIEMTAPEVPIDLVVHTPGGLVLAAEQIASSLAAHPSPDRLRPSRVQGGREGLDLRSPGGMLEFWADPTSSYHRAEFDPRRRVILYCAYGGGWAPTHHRE